MEDKELIYRIQHGEQELLEELITRYYDYIYRFCFYKTGNSVLSYDLVQETFFKLIKYIGTYKDKGKFKNYLITIALNVCNNYFYEDNSKNEVELEKSFNKSTNELSNIEEKNVIQEALNMLSEKQKDVIILKFYMGMKIKDIAKLLDEKVPTIKSRLKQGIDKLSKILREEDFYEK